MKKIAILIPFIALAACGHTRHSPSVRPSPESTRATIPEELKVGDEDSNRVDACLPKPTYQSLRAGGQRIREEFGVRNVKFVWKDWLNREVVDSFPMGLVSGHSNPSSYVFIAQRKIDDPARSYSVASQLTECPPIDYMSNEAQAGGNCESLAKTIFGNWAGALTPRPTPDEVTRVRDVTARRFCQAMRRETSLAITRFIIEQE